MTRKNSININDASIFIAVAKQNTTAYGHYRTKHVDSLRGGNIFNICASDLGFAADADEGRAWVDFETPDSEIAELLLEAYREKRDGYSRKHNPKPKAEQMEADIQVESTQDDAGNDTPDINHQIIGLLSAIVEQQKVIISKLG